MKFLILFLIFPALCFSQNGEEVVWGESTEIEPSFPGGTEGLNNYIKNNLEYPTVGCVSGVVYVQFLIDNDGVVKEVMVKKGVTKSMDEAAVKLVSNMPNWTRGSYKGHAVPVVLTLPIHFK